MSVIETQIWEAVPDKKAYERYVGKRKLVEVFNELEAYLKKMEKPAVESINLLI